MTDFQYDGLTFDGKPCQGIVRAPNAEAARLRLIGQRITPVRITGGDRGAISDANQNRGTTLRRSEVLLFSREMAHLKQANMPLDKALVMLKETAATDRLKAFIAKVEEGVRGGKSLYQSLAPFERDLGRQYLVLIRAGEASGSLPVVLKELTAQLEAQDKLRNYVVSSMTYPIILLVVAVLSVVLLLAFVVPQFREIFDSMGEALPYATQMVVSLSDLVRAHWMAILLGLTVLFFIGGRWAGTAGGRTQIDGMLLNTPLLGAVIKNLQFAIYFRTFGILLQRGVPMVDALHIAVDTLTNTALRKDIEPLVGIVKAGKRLSAGFNSRYLSKTSAPQLIRVAEETGSLDVTLLSLADRYEDEGRRTMGRVLSAMEPIIIIVLGAFVAFIIIAILGGVLSINETV